MARKPYYSGSIHHHPAMAHPFPQAPAPAPAPQPPLLPLPVHLQAPQSTRPVLRAKKPRHAAPSSSPRKPGASAPIVVAAPSKKRPAAGQEEATGWTSLYSVSPPPSSVPMPTSLLATAKAKAPTACAVEVAASGAVDVGATDELRRLLRL